jgi:hypothetical protein
MEKIFELGFTLSADFILNEDILINNIFHNNNSANILYVFANIKPTNEEENLVFYIGHTRTTFSNRMRGYRLGNGQNTNNRIHCYIKEQLELGKLIKVYVLNNIYNLNIRDLEIDIAAGLEYSLISYFANYNLNNNFPPLINIAGNYTNNTLLVNIPNEIQEIVEHEELNENFAYNLNSSTYWNTSNINVPKNLEHLFGDHNEEVIIEFYLNDTLVNRFNELINRNATQNGSPRIYIRGENGRWFINWKHEFFNQNSSINIKITDRNRLKINLI